MRRHNNTNILLPKIVTNWQSNILFTLFIIFQVSILPSFTEIIHISTAEQLQQIGHDINYPIDGNYLQTADIDLSTVSDFIPIPSPAPMSSSSRFVFTGTYDGNGYEIQNLSINQQEGDRVALFTSTSNSAELSNIKLINCRIKGNSIVGALVGHNEGNIHDIYITGYVDGESNYTGGITGINDGGTINSAKVNGIVSGNIYTGGITGQNTNHASIINSYTSCDVLGKGGVIGGIAGQSISSEITHSVSNGAVRSSCFYPAETYPWKNCFTGGIVGSNVNSPILYCASNSSVTGDWSVGGISGSSYSSNIKYCYSTGCITGNRIVGGLVGDGNSGIITNSFTTGHICKCGDSDGLVGFNLNVSLFNNFWDIDSTACPISTSTTASGKTTEEMTSLSTFATAGWNIADSTIYNDSNTWTIIDGITYPILTWMIPENGIPSNLNLSVIMDNNQAVLTSPQGPYNLNQPVTITVPVDKENTLSHWSGPGIGHDEIRIITTNTLTFAMTSDKEIKARTKKEIEISSLEDLQRIGTDTDYPLYGDYLQTANINLSGTPNFNPIGTSEHFPNNLPFSGTYNGNQYELQNMSINNHDLPAIGLFDYTSFNSVLSDIQLINCHIIGKQNVGGLVGINHHASQIQNCTVSGIIDATFDAGGLTGYNFGIIDNSHCIIELSGQYCLGGLAGIQYRYASINNCSAIGSISGTKECIGGLIGRNSGETSQSHFIGQVVGDADVGGLIGATSRRGTVSNCYSKGSVVGIDPTTSYSIGGLIGRNYGGSKVTSCFSQCVVIGFGNVGGLIGCNVGRDGTEETTRTEVSNCYASGIVIGNRSIGSLVGWSYFGAVNNNYATGLTIGVENVGGLIGNDYQGENNNNFWDIETTNQMTSSGDGATGKTTEGMLNFTTYSEAGWNIAENDNYTSDNIWTIVDGVTYPILTWQTTNGTIPENITLDAFVKGFGTIEVSPSAPYTLNQPVTITGIPKENCTFSHWELTNDHSILSDQTQSDSTFTLEISPDQEIIAVFEGVPSGLSGITCK